MGESLVESPPKAVTEMVESETDQVDNGSRPGGLQVSISFGKYEKEPLSWERWSTFPTNKYLEEVEKCKTPGSVAQKKAYFEAHYKKIAARKIAEQEQQQQQSPSHSDQVNEKRDELSDDPQVTLEHQTILDSSDNNFVEELDGQKSKVQDDGNGDGAEYRNDGVQHDDGGVKLISEDIDSACMDNGTVDTDVDQSKNSELVCEDSKDKSGTRPDTPKSNKAEELVFIREEAPSLGSQDMEECQGDSNPDKEADSGNNEAAEELQQDVHGVGADNNQESVKSEPLKNLERVTTTTKRNTNASAKKKLAPPSPRSPAIPSPKTSKPVLSKSVVSTPKTSKAVLLKSAVSTPKASKPVLSKSVVSTPKNAKPMPSKSVASTPKTAKPVSSQSVVPIPKIAKPVPSKSVFYSSKTPTAVLSKSFISTTSSPVKKEINTTPSFASKNSTKNDSRRIGPTSLHISISIGPTKSEPAAATLPETRKSLIMDSMGDKEIVRRAFKAFQNRYNQQASSGFSKPSSPSQRFNEKTDIKGSALGTSEKNCDGSAKVVKKAGVQHSKQTSRRSSLSSGYNMRALNDKSQKTGADDQRNFRTLASSFGSRINITDKQKQVPKNLDDRSSSKMAVHSQIQAEAEVQKNDVTKTLAQSFGYKSKGAKLATASYQRPGVHKAY